MRKFVHSILLVGLIAALPGFAKPHKSSASRSNPAASSSKKAAGSKAPLKKGAASKPSFKRSAGKASSSKKGSTASSRKRGSRTTRTAKGRARGSSASNTQQARRSYQQSPTTDRYREIQAALAAKGFYRGEPSGVWDADSVEALRAFQREQNLNPTGKLDSVSLIALGLGPKRTTTANTTPLIIQRPQDDNRRTEGSERP